MHKPVADNWVKYNTPIEGYLNVMYCDTLNYVTTGMGNKIDPLNAEGLSLPWRYKTTKYWASEADVKAEFNKIKKDDAPASKTVKTATLYLEDDVIDELIIAKLSKMETTLKKTFTEWDSWPADAQFCVLSMSWSMGEYFPGKFPNFTAAMKKQDFMGAIKHCQIGTNPKTRRNILDVQFLLNASMVKSVGKPVTFFNGNTVVLSASTFKKAAERVTPSSNAWYVQRQLQLLNLYTGPLDGLFGNDSKAAYKKFVDSKKLPNEFNVNVLTALGKASGYAWPVKD